MLSELALLGVVSDPAFMAIAASVTTIVTTVFGGLMTYFMAKIQQQGAAAAKAAATVAEKAEIAAEAVATVAVKADEVKDVLEASNQATSTKLDAIHTLVNSNMAAQLKISAVALRRISMLTNNEDDAAAADLAEKLFNEHEAKQAIVDKIGGVEFVAKGTMLKDQKINWKSPAPVEKEAKAEVEASISGVDAPQSEEQKQEEAK